jgi:hypothetical protein
MRENIIYIFAVNQNGKETNPRWIENGSGKDLGRIENGSAKDLEWIENGFKVLEFNVKDDLPFPLSLSPNWK